MNVGKGELNIAKKKYSNQPDYQGSVLIRGEMIRIVGWKKKRYGSEEPFLFLVANSPEKPSSLEQEVMDAFGGEEVDLRQVALVIRSMESEEKEIKQDGRKKEKRG